MVIRLIGGNQQVIHDIFYLLKKDLCSHSTKNLNDGHLPCCGSQEKPEAKVEARGHMVTSGQETTTNSWLTPGGPAQVSLSKTLHPS